MMTSERIASSSGLRAAGNEAWAQRRANTPEVVAISCDMRFAVIVVNTKENTTSAPAPRKTAARIISERDWSCAPSARHRGGTRRVEGSGVTTSLRRAQLLEASEVGPERRRDAHSAGFRLMVLEQRGVGPRQRHAGGIQRMRDLRLGAGFAPEAHAHAPRLEVLEVGAGRALEPGSGARRPDLEVVALRGGEAHVAAAEQHHAIRQLERLEDIRDVSRQLLVLVVARLRGDDL